MDGLAFLTPAAALVSLAALVPVGALAVVARRERRVRAALGLHGAPRPQRGLLLALAAVPALLGLAAAQPVLAVGDGSYERSDAEAWIVLDTSRSMLAAERPGLPTRYERAVAVAEAVRAGLPELRVGLASLTDRTLPHLFPTSDRRVFASTLARSMGIERPPPSAFYEIASTRLEALSALANRGFYSPRVRRRIAVVLTDGETQPVTAALRRALARPPGVKPVLVRFWSEDERVFGADGGAEEYRPDTASGPKLASLAADLDAPLLAEGAAEGIVAAVRRAAGPAGGRRELPPERVSLALWITAAAAAPLALVLVRRNL